MSALVCDYHCQCLLRRRAMPPPGTGLLRRAFREFLAFGVFARRYCFNFSSFDDE
ncbi:MAG: hypothetical protein AB7E74_15880 [Pirellulales bacterium]